MYGKIFWGDGKCNIFVIKRFEDKIICFVLGLEYYYKWISDNGINISLGYLFRFVMEKGRVLDKKNGIFSDIWKIKILFNYIGNRWRRDVV